MSAYDKINETVDEFNNTVLKDESLTKEEKNKKFFEMAANLFNEHIAGDVTTVTGEVIHTPKIEI